MKYPKVSFILPIYNVEQYLDECIKSIISQEYDNKEIILVDDGSTDKSGEICDRYSTEYSYINTVHIPNGGLSNARNTGLKYANGDYVLFVDSDDYIEGDVLTSIVSTAVSYNADVVFLEAQKVFSDGRVLALGDGITSQINGLPKDEVLGIMSECSKYCASACTKLIKKEIFDIPEMLFESGIYSEDVDWTFKLIKNAKTFAYCPDMYYNYRQGRADSITHTNADKRLADLYNILKKWYDQSSNLSGNLKHYVLSNVAYEYTMVMYLYDLCGKVAKNEYKSKIKSNLHILKYRTEKKYKLIYTLSKIFGIDLVSKLLLCYLKFR